MEVAEDGITGVEMRQYARQISADPGAPGRVT